MRVQLTLMDGEKIDKRVHLESITIGRSKNCDIVIVSESISRKHCLVEIKEGEFYITDLASINGVFIEGKKITPNEPTHFKSFFNITFGPVTHAQFTAENTLSGMIIQLKKQFENLTNPRLRPTIELESIQAPTQQPQQKLIIRTPNRPVTRPARYKSHKKKDNLFFLNFIVFIGVLFVLYHYLFDGENLFKTESQSTQSTKEKKPKIIENSDHF